MKQLVVEKNNPDPILLDTPIPKPGPGEVLIKNHYSVVSSGTELAAIEFANTGVGEKLQNSSNIEKGLKLLKDDGIRAVWNAVFPKNILPLQLGYSSSGEVVQTGKGVSDFHTGDRVVSNGNHAEYVVVNQNLCTRIPENTDIKEASFTVLGSIALHGLRLSETSLGSKVVVIGLGIIGQLVCRLAEAQGSEVIGIDPDTKRTDMSANFYTSVEEANMTNVDSVIITAATSSNEPIEVATKIARNKAKIVVVGDIPLNISRNDFYYKELELVVSKSYGPGRYDKQYEILGKDYPIEYVRWTENRNFEAFIKLLSQNQIHLLDLVTEEVPFENAPSIYKKFSGEDKPLSIVLRYDNKSEPKIDFQRTVELEPKTEKVNEEIDAVLILTPHFNHSELVIKALNKGKAIYVEKPLALTEESLIEIEEAIYNSENPKLFVGFNRRFADATQFVKQKLNAKAANSITFRFSVPPLDKDHWTNMKEIGGGRIVGEAIHAIDLACYLFDSLPQSVASSAPINKDNSEANENQVFINVNFANGSHAAIQYFSETNQSLAKERIEIHGGGNSYIIEDFQLLRYLENNQDKSKVFSSGKGHKESLQIFFDYVKNTSENPFTWLELKSISRAGIYAQDFINSGQQHSV